MKSLLFLAAFLSFHLALAASALQTQFADISFDNHKGNLHLRIGVQEPVGEPIGDVVYIHGFADRLDNHGPLFSAWAKEGLRVISFDLPSHGENSGSYNNLNDFSFENLAKLAARVEQITKSKDANRPLILAGWSTGGLIVVRALQEGWVSAFSRPIAGAILFAPGVAVRKVPWTFGDKRGFVTADTLTHNPNPPHVGGAMPNTPFYNHLALRFAESLLFNSWESQAASYPTNVKTLIFTGGDTEDVYAKSAAVREWIELQNASRLSEHADLIHNVQCPHADHEMDNELPAFGGEEVRAEAAAYAAFLANPYQLQRVDLKVCHIDN